MDLSFSDHNTTLHILCSTVHRQFIKYERTFSLAQPKEIQAILIKIGITNVLTVKIGENDTFGLVYTWD